LGREDEIKLIAYSKWEEEGCAHGRDCEHWYRAESIWEQQQNQKSAIKSHGRKPVRLLKGKPKE
jgi:hypothetical protein